MSDGYDQSRVDAEAAIDRCGDEPERDRADRPEDILEGRELGDYQRARSDRARRRRLAERRTKRLVDPRDF